MTSVEIKHAPTSLEDEVKHTDKQTTTTAKVSLDPAVEKDKRLAGNLKIKAKEATSTEWTEISIRFDLACRLSKLIYGTMEDDKETTTFIVKDVQNCKGLETLKLFIEWMNLYNDGRTPYIPRKPVRKDEKDSEIFGPDYELLKPFFAKVDSMQKVYNLINCANYFDASGLLHQMCAIVGRRLKEKLDINMVKTQLSKTANPFAYLAEKKEEKTSS